MNPTPKPPLHRQVQNQVGHGGRRRGAGRKPKGAVAGVSHSTRARHLHRCPAHVTVKLRRGLPLLRRPSEYATLRRAFTKGADRFGFRLIHYAVLNEHMHFVVEAKDRRALTRGLQGLLIRIAKALNKLWRRKGKVFFDRYHDRMLPSPREVRTALRYVLHNAKKHAAQGRKVRVPWQVDLFSSAPWFDGFREELHLRGMDVVIRPTVLARTWLLRVGWRRHGLIGVNELPATG